MLAHLLQPRVMAGVFGEPPAAPEGIVVGIEVGGPYTEGQTIVATIHRTGARTGSCSVGAQLTGVPDLWLVDPALQRVSLEPGQMSATASWRTRIAIGDQGDASVTATLVDAIGCTIDTQAASSIFSITDVSQPADPPTLSIARHADTPATIDEGETARFVVTSSYKGLETPATFDYVATTGTDADLVAAVTGNDVAIAGDADTVEIAAATSGRSGAQGNRTLTATISGAIGATILVPAASVTVRDVVPAPELPVPVRSIPATTATIRGILAGTSSYGALTAGDHIVLDDGTYTGSWIKISRSGTAANPIVLRAKNKLGAAWKIPLGIAGDYVRLWGLDLSNGVNVKPSTMSMTVQQDYACQFAVTGDYVEIWRCKLTWNRMRDSSRGANTKACHGGQVHYTCRGFKFMRNWVEFTGQPNLDDIPPGLNQTPMVKGPELANEIRPLVLQLLVGNSINNRDAEIGWNLFKGFPGDRWFDAVKYRGYGADVGYDNLVRGTVFGLGSQLNDRVLAKSQGIDIHHNVVVGNGDNMDFGGIRCDGQSLCTVRHNTNLSGDGIRLRVAQNWDIVANWVEGAARGFYGSYGPGHRWIGNRSAPEISARTGNCTVDQLTPWPANTDAAWVARGIHVSQKGNPKPANERNLFYGNRGPLWLGFWEYRSNAHDADASPTGCKVYGHMDLDGNLETTWGDTIVNKGYADDALIYRSVPASITVPTATKLRESDVGPNS
ncbi:MAG: chondroitinase-B domain-containing protein [Geminicoccaceae bacterium]